MQEAAKQIRALQLELDARVGQLNGLQENLTSVRAVRDQLAVELKVYKQILDDLHTQLVDQSPRY